MDNSTRALLGTALQQLYPDHVFTLQECSERRPWSQAFVVRHPQIEPMYLKGTPRSFPEADVTMHLARACPKLIPHVLHGDLLPSAQWRWFMTADAGMCDRLELSLSDAQNAAYAMGLLQRTVADDVTLAAALPACLPQQLYAWTLQSCDAMLSTCDNDAQQQLQSLRDRIVQAEWNFAVLAEHLQVFPATCVHGDF